MEDGGEGGVLRNFDLGTLDLIFDFRHKLIYGVDGQIIFYWQGWLENNSLHFVGGDLLVEFCDGFGVGND